MNLQLWIFFDRSRALGIAAHSVLEKELLSYNQSFYNDFSL